MDKPVKILFAICFVILLISCRTVGITQKQMTSSRQDVSGYCIQLRYQGYGSLETVIAKISAIASPADIITKESSNGIISIKEITLKILGVPDNVMKVIYKELNKVEDLIEVNIIRF